MAKKITSASTTSTIPALSYEEIIDVLGKSQLALAAVEGLSDRVQLKRQEYGFIKPARQLIVDQIERYTRLLAEVPAPE